MGALQGVLATTAIALSAFSLITYLWLGLTVLLLGNRRARVTLVGGTGLLLAALFFLCHGALVGAGTTAGAGLIDVWWHLSWLPAFGAPLCWAVIGLQYARMAGAWGRLRKLALGSAAALGGFAALLAAANWPAIASYGDFIRLLEGALYVRGAPPARASPLAAHALPALAVAFVAYMGVCASLPWAALVARRLLPGVAADSTVAGSEPTLLWDARSAWSQARPALFAASLCMLGAGAVVGLVGVVTSLAARGTRQHQGGRPPLSSVPHTPSHLPLALVAADLAVQASLAGLVLMVGWAVVRQGVLVERRLPQRGFLGHWRSTVIAALMVASVVAWLSALEPDSLPEMLLLVALVAVTYALFTWRSYAVHDRLLAQLRPFIDSLATSSGSWLATDPRAVERTVEALFTSLCRDVLEASHGRLALSAGHLHRTFTYHAPDDPSVAGHDPKGAPEWVLPIADERGVLARLTLGARLDGAGYTSADLEVARACGQRILDAVGEFTAVQTIARLARRRGLEAELRAALPRRQLHDNVLPRLHLAMLRLEALRGRLGTTARVALGSGTAAAAELAARTTNVERAGAALVEAPDRGSASPATEGELAAALGNVVRELGSVHHDLAALMRATPTASPRRLEHGFCATLRGALEGELRGAFDGLEWELLAEACEAADTLPDTVADLLLGATLEVVRNASRHARGGDLHRRLGLRVGLAADDHWVAVEVADDGVGLQSDHSSGAGAPVPAAGASTRSGLLTHAALLALVGGSLAVHSTPLAGTTVTLRVPRRPESLDV
jgi:hypothetical protein